MHNSSLKELPDLLLPWYEVNKRDLPWRKDREPYHVWLSEIMLQQTRVEAVKGFYDRFLNKLPTLSDLANADDALLEKLWEGLGYYSRVRNLKKTANVVADTYNGVFPVNHEDVLRLPGIGPYTAGAICSICYDLKTPAVDGNVLRVISRLTDDTTPIDLPAFKKRVHDLLLSVYPDQAGAFTQALMELGATVCGPNRAPECGRCPCLHICKAAKAGTAQSLPVKMPKRARRIEEITVFVLSCDGKYALQKRPNAGLLSGLWQFPNIPNHLDASAVAAAVEGLGLKLKDISRVVERKHIFTHVEWHMRGLYAEVSEMNPVFSWFDSVQINQETALPTAFRMFWEELNCV